MGYSTDFTGELRFTHELTGSQLAALSGILGEDCRDHKDWGVTGLYRVDLELTRDFGGIKWDGMEKTYNLDKIVNVVIREMRKVDPAFGLMGQLQAQGERYDDRWVLVIGEDGWAQHRGVTTAGMKVKCPCCEETFFLEDAVD